MYKGYHRTLRKAAAASVFVEAFLPDVRLGIGPAEILRPVAPMVAIKPRVSLKAKLPSYYDMDNIQIGGHGALFKEESFPMVAYYGEGIAYGF